MDVLRTVRPRRLYFASDGPRPDRPGEAEAVASTRELALSLVDWDCQVATLFRDDNLGCRRAIAGGISWFFEQEEAGIIFEDDVLPHLDFFRYCDALLTRYETDHRVMHIGGSTLTDFDYSDETYFFSRYPMIWGFATWRRAWSQFTLDPLPREEMDHVVGSFRTEKERNYWRNLLEWFYGGGMDTWDYPWAVTIWRADGVSISSRTNLVSNIGFGDQATNTKRWKDFRGLGNRPRSGIGEIRHPASIEIDDALDYKVFVDAYEKPPLPIHALKILRHMIGMGWSSLARMTGGPALPTPVSQPLLGAAAPGSPSRERPEDTDTD